MVEPTVRDRQVFAALMDELLSHMPKGNRNFPNSHTVLSGALDQVKETTAQEARKDEAYWAALDAELSTVDWRE